MSTEHAPHLTFDFSRFTSHVTPRASHAILILLAFFLRLYHLDAQPIWWDEAISIHLATSSLTEIVANRAGNLHPPLYFFLLKGWLALVGDSPFGARFFSAFWGTLLVPAVYAFARRWLTRRTGRIAAILAAVWPLYIVYAQEARVYAILPLLYLALLGLSRRLAGAISGRLPALRHWLLLVGVEILALGLHYMSFFAVAYILIALTLRLRHRRTDLLRLLLIQGLVFLLLLPWLLAVLRHSDAIAARFGMSNWQTEPVTPMHLVRLLWTFQLTGLTAFVSDPTIAWLTLTVGWLLAGWLACRIASPFRQRAILLLLDWLVPLASAFIVWWIRPLSHPRYVILFTPALLLLSGYALDGLTRGRWAARGSAVLLALSLLAITAFSLRAYFFDPHFAKDDTRGVAAMLEPHAGPGDLILVPPEDWSVPYYYDGLAQVEMVWPHEAWGRLRDLTHAGQIAYLVGYYRGSRDPAGILPFALEAAGSLIERWDFKGLFARVYRLDRPVVPPSPRPTGARFGPLRLTGVWVEQGAPADTAIAIALRWRPVVPADTHLRISLRLRDDEGWAWASSDDWLLDPQGNPTDRWAAGQEVSTYHLLPLPPGTPPLTYTLTLGVYRVEGEQVEPLDLVDEAGNPQGQSLDLEIVALEAALGLETDPYGVADRVPLWDTPVGVTDGLLLTGASLDREAVSPGQPLYVTLRWQGGDESRLSGRDESRSSGRDESRSSGRDESRSSGRDESRPYMAALSLVQGDVPLVVATAPVGGRYPAHRWIAGETVVEHRRLVVPPTAADGPAVVVLQVEDCRIELGAVAVSASEHRFEPPPMGQEFQVRFGDVAELLGYDLEATEIAAGQPVALTLYWRALEGADRADYAVFTHILAEDGHLVGQHDGPPAEGARPTQGWMVGEIVVDRHVMTFREPYIGPAWIEVGLYDPTTLERVPVEGGGTFVLLPTPLTVQEP